MTTTASDPRRRWLAGLVLATVLAAAAVFGLRTTAPDAGVSADATATRVPSEAGEPAPDVTFTMVDGQEASLADFQGRPLVLNFWASWCPPCVAEMGDALRPVHEAHGDEVGFLGMNLRDDPAAAQRILDATGVTYDLALDPDGAVFAAFGGLGMPTTVFIDSEGHIVDRHTGAITREQLEAQVTSLRGT